MNVEAKSGVVYNPSAIVNIFNNALNSEATRKIITARGVYLPGRGQSYSGYYYDQLKDEASDACITLIVPALIRTGLAAQQTIECCAYLTKKVQVNGARIELQLNLTELLEQKESKYTEEQVQAFKVLQRKAATGYKDVDAFVKMKIIKGEPLQVIILIGKTGIIDSDIRHQLEETISCYDFKFVRINLSSEQDIVEALQNHHSSSDILIISRGGGDRLEVFNKPSIAEAALQVSCHFITAIGHQQDNSLLQKIADKAFITPTALGQYFNDIYNRTIEELQNSKARLVEDITTQLQANYAKQISNLEAQLTAKEELHSKASAGTAALYKQEVDLLKNQIAATMQQQEARAKERERINEEKIRLAKGRQTHILIYRILIIASAVLGIVLGRGCR